MLTPPFQTIIIYNSNEAMQSFLLLVQQVT